MKTFAVADLSGRGDVRSNTPYQYDLLEQLPGATDLLATFAANVWRSPDEFDLSRLGGSNLSFRWRSTSESSGIATLRDPTQTASVSLLITGQNSDADYITLETFQKHIVRELHDTGFEPSFDLMELQERPLLATVGLVAPQESLDRQIFALADRCFAAAFLRRLGLA